jgi:hypothetical protein
MPSDCWRSIAFCPTVRIVDPDRTPDAAEGTDRPVVTRRTPNPRPGAKAADGSAGGRAAGRPASTRSAADSATSRSATSRSATESVTARSAAEPATARPAAEPATTRLPADGAAESTTDPTPVERSSTRTAATLRVSVPEADAEPTVQTTRVTPAAGAQPTVRSRSVTPDARPSDPRSVDPRGADRASMVEPTVPTNIYRARRPVVAIFLVIPAVGVGLLLIHALAVAAFGKTLLIGGMIGSSLALASLPLLVAGLYGLITGAAHGAEQWGFKVWARPPLAYLVVGLGFVLAAGLAVRGV